jgi:hypothetical protein
MDEIMCVNTTFLKPKVKNQLRRGLGTWLEWSRKDSLSLQVKQKYSYTKSDVSKNIFLFILTTRL